MVQTVIYRSLQPGQQKIFFEKPRVLSRIFLKIVALIQPDVMAPSKISFDDPQFRSYFVLIGRNTYFIAQGKGIFQGNIWVRNQTSSQLAYTGTEILV